MEVVEACEFTLNSEVKETIQGQSRRSDKSLHTLVVQQTEVKYWNRHANNTMEQQCPVKLSVVVEMFYICDNIEVTNHMQ